jgi:hypothetical protein
MCLKVVDTRRKVTVDSLYAVLESDYRINGKTIEWAERVWNIHLKDFFDGVHAKNVGTDPFPGISKHAGKRMRQKAQSTGSYLYCKERSCLGMSRNPARLGVRCAFTSPTNPQR